VRFHHNIINKKQLYQQTRFYLLKIESNRNRKKVGPHPGALATLISTKLPGANKVKNRSFIYNQNLTR